MLPDMPPHLRCAVHLSRGVYPHVTNDGGVAGAISRQSLWVTVSEQGEIETIGIDGRAKNERRSGIEWRNGWTNHQPSLRNPWPNQQEKGEVVSSCMTQWFMEGLKYHVTIKDSSCDMLTSHE